MNEIKSKNITPQFIDILRDEFVLDWNGIHGAPHWSRVRLNGLILAKANGADQSVIEYFSFLHDVCRRNDGVDPVHGSRAAELAQIHLRDEIRLDSLKFEILIAALEGHSHGNNPGDITIATCWDADRLDLGRVGIRPNPDRLFTQEAKRLDVINASWNRSHKWLIGK
jgi:uncharacterized protein